VLVHFHSNKYIYKHVCTFRYNILAEELTKRGFLVYGADHYAHGLSYGTRGLVDDHNVLIRDQLAVISNVRSRHPSTYKLFLLGHSMGTLVAMNTCTLVDPPVTALVLSGTAVTPGPAAASPFGLKFLYPLGQTSLGLHLAGCLSTISQKGPAAPIYTDAIVNSQSEREILVKDPRRYDGDIMNKTAFEVLKMSDAGKTYLQKITCPVLLVHGGADEVCYPSGSEYTYNALGTPDEEKELIIYDSLKHEMFRDDGGEVVINDVVGFFEKHSVAAVSPSS
jgi:acylglycerol lipase